jgi:nucleoside-diphosphate-sugar epimerase
VRLLVDDLGRELHVSADKAKRVLGWQPRGLHEMARDTARAITERRRATEGQSAVTR